MIKMDKEPIELVRELEQKLIALGITDFETVNSVNNFGKSAYLQNHRFKVRASDHSTGVYRAAYEIPLFCPDAVATIIERMYYPERFETTTEYVFGDVHEERADFLEEKRKNSYFEIKVVEPEYRKTKKGKVICLIKIKNVPRKTTRRKTTRRIQG